LKPADSLFITDDARIDSLRKNALALKPDLVIVDSIQSLRYSNDGVLSLENMRSARHLLAELMELKKELNTAIVLVGHFTKGNDIAGSAQIQHMVDLVVKLDIEETTGDRVLTVKKNRFASISGTYRFMMSGSGEIIDAPPAPVVNYRTPTVIG